MNLLIKENERVLFQGDSITDAGRSRNGGFGFGYAMMAKSFFENSFPRKNVCFLNRGMGGNKIKDLAIRWQQDCLDLKPDWVTLLIGINDVRERYLHGNPVPLHEFEKVYRDLLTQVAENSQARLILCEPFLLPLNESISAWCEDLNPKRKLIRDLAGEFDALFIPLHQIFVENSHDRSPDFWASDGIHPTLPGHGLIAQSWLETIRAIGD